MSSSTDFDFVFGKWHAGTSGSGTSGRIQRLGDVRRHRRVPSDPRRPRELVHFTTEWSGGLVGMALRPVQSRHEEWSIYWGAHERPGILERRGSGPL